MLSHAQGSNLGSRVSWATLHGRRLTARPSRRTPQPRYPLAYNPAVKTWMADDGFGTAHVEMAVPDASADADFRVHVTGPSTLQVARLPLPSRLGDRGRPCCC